MRITLRSQLLDRFRSNWKQEGEVRLINAQVIEDVMHPVTGKKHETIGRELRRMAEDGIITKQEIKNQHTKVSSVYYAYIPTRHELLSEQMKKDVQIHRVHSS